MGKQKAYVTGICLLFMFLHLSNLSLAQTAGRDSLSIALAKAKDPFQKFDILFGKGFETAPQSNRKALYYYLRAYNIIKNTNDTAHICSALIAIGHMYLNISIIDSALIYMNQDIFLANKAHLKRWEGIGLSDIGELYFNTNNTAKAEEYYNKAYLVIKESGNKYYLLNILLNRGILKYSTNQYDEALKCFFEALPIVSTKNHAFMNCEVLIDIGNTYLKMQKTDEAKKYALSAYQMSQTISSNQTSTKATQFLGKCYIPLAKYDSAEFFLNQSLKFARMASMSNELCETYNLLVELYEAQGNNKSALVWFRKYVALKDSNASKENAAHIADLDQKYESHAKEQTIALLSRDKAIQKSEQEKNELKDAEAILRLKNEKDIEKLENAKKVLSVEKKVTALNAQQSLQKVEIGRQRAISTGIAVVAFLIIIGGVIVVVNNRRIRFLNANLDRQKKELTQINDVKDKLFAIISHDMRNPLVTMDAMLEMLQEGSLSEEKMEKHSKRLSGVLKQNIQLLDNLLQWAASQMSGLQVHKKEVNISELIKENILLVQSILDSKNITLTEKSEKDLKVFADISMIRLVLRNLLSNAVKFTPEGGKISLKTALKDNSVWVEVSDNGIGMDENLKESIQSGLLKESKPGTKFEKGFGIGLMLCREFIEKNGGVLFINSTPGVGSTFSFNIPLAA